MTKSEYREYINSADWQERRKKFLAANPNCERCDLPRWLAQVAYDQDLHVHHRSYAHLGDEHTADLEILCRRCHEIETFGRSDLREVKRYECSYCGEARWNPYEKNGLCEVCAWFFMRDDWFWLVRKAKSIYSDSEMDPNKAPTVATWLFTGILFALHGPLKVKEVVDFALDGLSEFEKRCAEATSGNGNGKVG